MGVWSRWFGKRLTARDGALYDFLGGDDTWAGESVTPKGALNLSAFWAGTRITAETVASLSLDVMEKRSDGVKVRVTDHPLQALLDESPNAEQTAIEFWEERVLGLCTTGNAFAEKAYSGARLVALNPMPAETAVVRNSSGKLEFRFPDRGKEIVLPAEKVFHLKAFGEGDVGFSPVEYARQTLSLTIATEKMAGQAFSKGLRSKGFFVMPPGAKLNDEARASAKKNFVDANSGPNAPWAMLLEGGMDFKTISLSMRDAEMILNRRFNVEDVCRWLGLPPILVGHAAEGQTMWGTGVSAIMQNWLNLSLRNRLKRIEQAITKRIMTPEERRRFAVKFNYEDLLRTDTEARYKAYEVAIRAGFKTINQVRRLEGDEPVDGGDEIRTQMQNVPIDQADAAAQENQP
ncbi:phage portal protein [Aurantimonas endophytica]|uniref:HK97 family phage portal protein n=1 Tax=Aurantimonas endophytica TaxID=1522175 RepID=A0A7W6HAE4_9HYPH|nr:phage portal protein [Aurantimonas endophytica]MBB4001585.1 HK97 family phage portal protein [Aurantimonas endophytica]MCO6402775.1 phage portal protein [Aurantimonas endophytica]